jgi:hypothetical protein
MAQINNSPTKTIDNTISITNTNITLNNSVSIDQKDEPIGEPIFEGFERFKRAEYNKKEPIIEISVNAK